MPEHAVAATSFGGIVLLRPRLLHPLVNLLPLACPSRPLLPIPTSSVFAGAARRATGGTASFGHHREGGRLRGRRPPIRLPRGRKHVAAHHRHPPLPSNPLVPVMVSVHTGARRNQFSTFRVQMAAIRKALMAPKHQLCTRKYLKCARGRGYGKDCYPF